MLLFWELELGMVKLAKKLRIQILTLFNKELKLK